MVDSSDDGLGFFRGLRSALLIYWICACIIALFMWIF